jgi:hypothetical protein
MIFYPGINRKEASFGGIRIKEVNYTEKYIGTGTENYALFVLDSRI